MPKLLSRPEAIMAGSPHYFTGRVCRNGHVAERYTNTGACIQCHSEHRKRHREKYPEKKAAENERYKGKLREQASLGRALQELADLGNPAALAAIALLRKEV